MSKPGIGILKKGKTFTINGGVWLECNGKRFFGPGPAELLERINDTGSISEAARQMHMSYKKAWEIINALNTKAAQPLVITQTGGSAGGGSSITAEGKAMVTWYRQLRSRFEELLEKETTNLTI